MPDGDVSVAERLVGEESGEGDHGQGEDGVDDEDDQLVAEEEFHHADAVAFTNICELFGDAFGGAEGTQGGEALDGVQVGGGEFPPGADGLAGDFSEHHFKAADEDGHRWDGEGEPAGDFPVDGRSDDEDGDDGGQHGADHGAEEGLPVIGDAFGIVGEQADDATSAFCGAFLGAEAHEVVDEFVAKVEFFPDGGGLCEEEAEPDDEDGDERQDNDAGDGATADICAVVGSVNDGAEKDKEASGGCGGDESQEKGEADDAGSSACPQWFLRRFLRLRGLRHGVLQSRVLWMRT